MASIGWGADRRRQRAGVGVRGSDRTPTPALTLPPIRPLPPRESDTGGRESDTGGRESGTAGRESDTGGRESDTRAGRSTPRSGCPNAGLRGRGAR